MSLCSDHRYWIELLREPAEELLLQEPFEGLELLADEARYELVSQGLLADEPDLLATRCKPLIQAPGHPSLGGIRFEVAHASARDEVFAVDFPKEIAASRGLELASQLVSEGILQEGDSYRVRLVTAPRRSGSLTTDASAHDEGAAVLCESPFPVSSLPLQSWGINAETIAAADRLRPVFVARGVVDKAIAAAIHHGHDETGSLLLGLLVEDRALRAAGCRTSWAVVVTEQVPVIDDRATTTSFTFSPEAFRQARQLAALRGRGESVVGSQHSHGWNCPACAGRREIRNLFFSTEDQLMTHHFPVYGAFLVVGGDPDRSRDSPVMNLYVRLRGTIHAIAYGTY
jgi:hypothetical protein